jgi:hypothetical protein
VQLLSLRPQLLERYEGVDAQGRTIRRIAVLNEDVSMEIDASVPAPVASSPAPSRPPPAPALPCALQHEVDVIAKRYPGGRSSTRGGRISQTAELAPVAAVLLTVPVAPTDPDWAAADGPLILECWADSSYPCPGSFSVALSPSCTILPQLEREVLDKLLAVEVARASGRLDALRSVLRRCETHGGALAHEAADVALEVQRRRAEMAAGAAERSSGAPTTSSDGGSSGSEGGGGVASSEGSELSSGEEDGGDRGGDGGPETTPGGGGWQAEAGASHGALRLTLEGLELVDIDALEPLTLNLRLGCGRCRAGWDACFAMDAAAGGGRHAVRQWGECGTCHAAWEASAAPRLVHERSNVLATVSARGCAPLDLLPSVAAAQCGVCGAQAAFRSVHVGRWNERQCSACHRRLAFKLDAALFAARTAGGGGNGAPRGAGGADGGQDLRGSGPITAALGGPLIPGQPLPNHGACAHYRHSYRWLRFPCCGRRFPCDLCHEIGVEDGHEMRWAQRMVCGYCSVEQPTGERCGSCGKKLAGSAHNPNGRSTRFWEGGQGERDPRRLSRKDPRRYANRSKTRSNKAGRVGQKLRDRGD